VAATGTYTVGVKSDGTVVAVGSNYYGESDVYDWELDLNSPSIPTLSQFGMIIMTILLLATGILLMRRQQSNNRK
jgi:hypothetical protein